MPPAELLFVLVFELPPNGLLDELPNAPPEVLLLLLFPNTDVPVLVLLLLLLPKGLLELVLVLLLFPNIDVALLLVVLLDPKMLLVLLFVGCVVDPLDVPNILVSPVLLLLFDLLPKMELVALLLALLLFVLELPNILLVLDAAGVAPNILVVFAGGFVVFVVLLSDPPPNTKPEGPASLPGAPKISAACGLPNIP